LGPAVTGELEIEALGNLVPEKVDFPDVPETVVVIENLKEGSEQVEMI
jgi:hypothetical protein